MHILDKIVARKKAELAERRGRRGYRELVKRLEESPAVPGFAQALGRDEVNIIAEVKYSSPSHGPFAIQWEPEEVVEAYLEGGAAAVSVLTDEAFFDGDLEYLRRLRERFEDLPLLEKDFVLDRYQIAEARLLGASAYLLIVACLGPRELPSLIAAGGEFDLDPLVEVHGLRELESAVEAGARLIGANNRDLKTFQVDLDASFRIARALEGEQGFLLVSESGLDEPLQIQELRDAGFSAFLVGSSLMDSDDPAAQLRHLRGEE